MQRKKPQKETRTEAARNLAGRLYDYKLIRLMNMSEAEKASLMAEYPRFKESEFNLLLEQVINAKRFEQERIGWQAVPHDVTVLVIVVAAWLADIRAAVIAGVAVLVLLESLFLSYFDRRLYRYLSSLVWLTYPAYLLLAYILYRRGYELIWIIAAIVLTWGGTFLLGIIARLPIRLILEAKERSL